MDSLPVIRGQKITIGPFPETEEFYQTYWGWMHQEEIMEGTGAEGSMSINEVKSVLKEWKEDPLNYTFCVFSNENNQPVGDVGLRYHPGEPNPEINVMIAAHSGKGMGYEAMYLVIEWGFSNLKAEAITGHIYTDNYASLNINRKLGFVFGEPEIDPVNGKPEHPILLSRERWESVGRNRSLL